MSDWPAEHGTAPLSPRQAEVLRVIVRFYEATGEHPSERYLSRRLGVHLTVIQGHVAALFKKGYLATPTPGGLRCLHIERA